MGPSSVPLLLVLGDTVSKVLQGPMDFIREEQNAATGLCASPLAVLESVHNDLSVASGTVDGRISTVASLRSGNSQLRGEVGCLMSEVNSSQALHGELDVFRQRSPILTSK